MATATSTGGDGDDGGGSDDDDGEVDDDDGDGGGDDDDDDVGHEENRAVGTRDGRRGATLKSDGRGVGARQNGAVKF